MKKVSITHMSNKHNDWLRALDFYKQEINILKGRLTEIAGKNSATDVLKQVEHYENQCTIQSDNIDRLCHNINENVSEAGRQAHDSGAGYVDADLLATHDELEKAFTREEKTVNILRHEFNQFAAMWM